jgi:hypothetical protein
MDLLILSIEKSSKKIPAPAKGSFVTKGGTRKIPALLTEKNFSNVGNSDSFRIALSFSVVFFRRLNNLLGLF